MILQAHLRQIKYKHVIDSTYISNNKNAGKDIRYTIPGHTSNTTFIHVIDRQKIH